MNPSVSILQLDTHFPRVPGDVACAQTYVGDVEIIRIANASVGSIVSSRPDLIDIEPFEKALKSAKGDVIVTSCGFLSYWQTHLAALTQRPFISSALIAFEHLAKTFTPEEILTLTFDQDCLTHMHFGKYPEYAKGVVGLPPDMDLRQVIANDRRALDVARASADLARLAVANKGPQHKHIVLECTNLPPYKTALQAATGLGVTDILSCIEAVQNNSVRPQFMGNGTIK